MLLLEDKMEKHQVTALSGHDYENIVTFLDILCSD